MIRINQCESDFPENIHVEWLLIAFSGNLFSPVTIISFTQSRNNNPIDPKVPIKARNKTHVSQSGIQRWINSLDPVYCSKCSASDFIGLRFFRAACVFFFFFDKYGLHQFLFVFANGFLKYFVLVGFASLVWINQENPIYSI